MILTISLVNIHQRTYIVTNGFFPVMRNFKIYFLSKFPYIVLLTVITMLSVTSPRHLLYGWKVIPWMILLINILNFQDF